MKLKTYKTFAEAKLANHDSIIFNNADGFAITPLLNSKIAKPQDHLITVEKFLADGHKFVVGDKFIATDGEVVEVASNGLSEVNEPCTIGTDKHLYVLKADAFELSESESEYIEITLDEWIEDISIKLFTYSSTFGYQEIINFNDLTKEVTLYRKKDWKDSVSRKNPVLVWYEDDEFDTCIGLLINVRKDKEKYHICNYGWIDSIKPLTDSEIEAFKRGF